MLPHLVIALLSLLQLAAFVSGNPAQPLASSTPSLSLSQLNLQFNFSLPNGLLSGGANNNRPGIYEIPHATTPTTLQIAWHFGRLPQSEFNLLILRAMNTIVDIVTKKPRGDAPLDEDRVTFRSPGCHIQARKEDAKDAKFTYSILAGVIRGIGEIMAVWGAAPADMFVVVGGERIARVYIDLNRRPG